MGGEGGEGGSGELRPISAHSLQVAEEELVPIFSSQEGGEIPKGRGILLQD